MNLPGLPTAGGAVGIAEGLLPRGSGPDPLLTPPYGMTMWFDVSVSDLDGVRPGMSLGTWSACSGLDVQLTPEGPFDEGGNYTVPHYLPGKITYGKVTLERAMTQAGAIQVRRMLELQARDWGRGVGRAELSHAAVVVKLFSGLGHNDKLIHTWELKDAVAVGWTIPPFSTTGSGGVAVEKLTLVHGGFLRPVELVPGHELQLIEKDDAGSSLSFEFNPAKITLTRQREADTGRGKVDTTTVVVDPNAVAITLADLRLEGSRQIAKAVPQLRRWIELQGGRSATAEPAPKAAIAGDRPTCPECERLRPSVDDKSVGGAPVVLRLVWGLGGGGMPKEMLLKSFELNFVRFTAAGEPSRAMVRLTLQEYKNDSQGAAARPAATPKLTARRPAGRQS